MKQRAMKSQDDNPQNAEETFLNLVLLFLVCCLSGCNGPTGPKYVDYPVQFYAPTFLGPNTNSTSLGVLETDSIISYVNSFIPRDVQDLCSGSPSTQSDTCYTWIGHDSSGDVVSWTATSMYTTPIFNVSLRVWLWEYRVNGVLKYRGHIDFGGDQGAFGLYSRDSIDEDAVIVWNCGSYGVSGTLTEWGKDRIENRVFDFADNPDKSGSLDVWGTSPEYISYTCFRSTWNADGSGEWWDYDSTGRISYHGSW